MGDDLTSLRAKCCLPSSPQQRQCLVGALLPDKARLFFLPKPRRGLFFLPVGLRFLLGVGPGSWKPRPSKSAHALTRLLFLSFFVFPEASATTAVLDVVVTSQR